MFVLLSAMWLSFSAEKYFLFPDSIDYARQYMHTRISCTRVIFLFINYAQ